MEDIMLLKDLTARKEEIRNRLLQVIMKEPKSIAMYADFIGLSVTTMRSFLNGRTEPTFKTLCLVAKFVEEREKVLKK